jgi:hypothetical protein
MPRDKRQKRDLHALDDEGMVLCNPRDKEAAHRAQMEGIATEDRSAVTCRKCLSLLHKLGKTAGSSAASESVCVEYFTIGHQPIFHTDDPTLLAFGWGVSLHSASQGGIVGRKQNPTSRCRQNVAIG